NLYIQLVGPNFATVNLSSLEPISSSFVGPANFLNTIFDDRAGTKISEAPPPFRGTFQPDGIDLNFLPFRVPTFLNLASLNGISPNGTWHLQIWDQGSPLPDFDTIGTLVDWSITVQVGLPSGGLNSVRMTKGGSGYTSAPTVTFLGGGGFGAAGVATISGGVVTGVTLTSNGSGYTSPPTVVFTGGGGTGAAAVAVINPIGQLGNYVDQNQNSQTLDQTRDAELLPGDVFAVPEPTNGIPF